MWKTAVAFFVLLFGLVLSAAADDSGRIYGRITTVDGDIFEGFIRWDKNEGSWVDMLDGTKDLPRNKHRRSEYRRERRTSFKIFGIEIARSSSDRSWWSSAQTGIRFGHIETMDVVDDDAVLLTLKSGQEVEFTEGSTDIGTDIREIIIEDRDEGEIELVWDDLETIDFMSPPAGLKSEFGERLYGTLTTRRGKEFTGFVCWDVDELFPTDILDGEEKGRKRKIKFGDIAVIERYSSNAAKVTLTNGKEMVLRGSNDVDDGNRGIIISDPGFGQVQVEWDEFDRLEFSPAPYQVTYDQFDGGKPLWGTVYTEDDDSYTGEIRWDDDEEYTWEILDGSMRGLDFEIEFSKIKSIRKRSYRSSVVTLWDGRTFRLRGSNDVDEDNKGIFITLDDGEEVEVDWEDFDRVEFKR